MKTENIELKELYLKYDEAVLWLMKHFPNEIQTENQFDAWNIQRTIAFYEKVSALYNVCDEILTKWHSKPSNMHKKEPKNLEVIRKGLGIK